MPTAVAPLSAAAIEAELGYTPADDAAAVHLSGDETIAGVKTVTGSVVVSKAALEQVITPGLSLVNPTLASAEVTKQFSPAAFFRASVWRDGVEETQYAGIYLDASADANKGILRFAFGQDPEDMTSPYEFDSLGGVFFETVVANHYQGTWEGDVIAPEYLGTEERDGTKFLRDDGTWQAVVGGGGGTTINATDTFLPYRLDGSAFADSPIARLGANSIKVGNVGNFAGLSIVGNAAGSGLVVTVLSSGTNENIDIIPKGTGAIRMPVGTLLAAVGAPANTGVRWGGGDVFDIMGANRVFMRLNMNPGNERIGLDGGIAWCWSKASLSYAIDSEDPSIIRVANRVFGIGTDYNEAYGATFRFKATTPAQITSAKDNFNPGGKSFYIELNSDAAYEITGLVFGDAWVDGQTHIITNAGAFALTLKHQNASSTASNRFIGIAGADVVLAAGESAFIKYSAGSVNRIRILFKM